MRARPHHQPVGEPEAADPLQVPAHAPEVLAEVDLHHLLGRQVVVGRIEAELRDLLHRRDVGGPDHAGLDQRGRVEVRVAPHRREHVLAHRGEHLGRDPPVHAEVDDPDPPVERSPSGCPGADRSGRSRRGTSCAGRRARSTAPGPAPARRAPRRRRGIVDLHALEELHREHAAGGQVPVDARHADVRGELAGRARGCPRSPRRRVPRARSPSRRAGNRAARGRPASGPRSRSSRRARARASSSPDRPPPSARSPGRAPSRRRRGRRASGRGGPGPGSPTRAAPLRSAAKRAASGAPSSRSSCARISAKACGSTRSCSRASSSRDRLGHHVDAQARHLPELDQAAAEAHGGVDVAAREAALALERARRIAAQPAAPREPGVHPERAGAQRSVRAAPGAAAERSERGGVAALHRGELA